MSRNSRQAVAIMTSSPRIEPTLLRVLKGREGTPFTRKELLTAYHVLKHEHGRNQRATRQFIDRNLIRLTKAAVLTVIEGTPDEPTTYRFGGISDHGQHPKPPDTLKVLRQKLQQQRVELLSTIGETEAYDEICADLPELQACVQTQYDDARDRSLKLLGRIRALETLIAAHSATIA